MSNHIDVYNSNTKNNLFIFSLSNIEYENNLLYIVSFSSIIFGVYTIISKNPIVSVLFLIGLFTSISLYLILVGLYFIGLSYLLVYIGAISILFVFILMLINIRISELLTESNNSVILGILTVIFFNISLYETIPYNINITDVFNIDKINWIFHTFIFDFDFDANEHKNTKNVESKSWDSMLLFVSHISSIGNLLYTVYLVPFFVLSLILFLAMVGAILITISKSKSN